MAEYLAPKIGPGLRDWKQNSTGPEVHGRVVNPPRMAPLGGFSSTSKGTTYGTQMKLAKGGGGTT